MIFVSYTRNDSKVGHTISALEQKKKITAYAKEKKITISKRYADLTQDKNACDAYFELKADGINRKFDCVVFWSVMDFGKDALEGILLLQNSFVPCGIHFVSVKDGFVSYEHTTEEISEYLDTKFKERKYKKERTPIPPNMPSSVLYGYCVENNTYLIDDEVAPIVKKIFEMFLDGNSVDEIIEYLETNRVDSPYVYFDLPIILGFKKTSDHWNRRAVRRILSDDRYAGVWKETKYRDAWSGEIPPYIDWETHLRILEMLEEATHHVSEKYQNPFSRMIFDKENLLSLYVCQYRGDDTKSYRNSQKPDTIQHFPRMTIPVAEVEEQVKKRLNEEKELAIKIEEILQTDIGRSALTERESTYVAEINDVFEKMLIYADETMPAGSHSNDKTFIELDRSFLELQAKIQRIRQTFSPENPWIRLYRSYDPDSVKDYLQYQQYIKRILVFRMTTVECELKEREWKNALPQEWMVK